MKICPNVSELFSRHCELLFVVSLLLMSRWIRFNCRVMRLSIFQGNQIESGPTWSSSELCYILAWPRAHVTHQRFLLPLSDDFIPPLSRRYIVELLQKYRKDTGISIRTIKPCWAKNIVFFCHRSIWGITSWGCWMLNSLPCWRDSLSLREKWAPSRTELLTGFGPEAGANATAPLFSDRTSITEDTTAV